MEQLTEKEKIELFELFLDESNNFYAFKEFLAEKGYSLEELGISE